MYVVACLLVGVCVCVCVSFLAPLCARLFVYTVRQCVVI